MIRQQWETVISTPVNTISTALISAFFRMQRHAQLHVVTLPTVTQLHGTDPRQEFTQDIVSWYERGKLSASCCKFTIIVHVSVFFSLRFMLLNPQRTDDEWAPTPCGSGCDHTSANKTAGWLPKPVAPWGPTSTGACVPPYLTRAIYP